MTKVLWIITNGIKRNGICVSQLDYYKNINKELFQVDVVAVHNNTKDMIDEYRANGCRVFELTDRRKSLVKYLDELKKLIMKEKYDIVHVHGSSALMTLELKTAKKCGVPVRIAHSRNTTCDKKLLDKVLRPSFNRNYNIALACGQDAGKWLFGKRDFMVFHNGKKLDKYMYSDEMRREIREKYKFGSKIVFGHVGLFNTQKNHDFLIDVFANYYKENNNSILVLIGEGIGQYYLVEQIKQKVNDYGLNDAVMFLGRQSNVNELIQGFDIMLFPSLYEGLPNVVLEWQAAGLPSIISDKITTECAVCDLVNFLPIDNGTEEWTKKIKQVIQEKRNRQEDSNVACQLLQKNNFDIEKNVKKLEEIYMQNAGGLK